MTLGFVFCPLFPSHLGFVKGTSATVESQTQPVLVYRNFANCADAVFTVPEQLSCGIVTANEPFSQHGRAVTLKGCVQRKWRKKERERQAKSWKEDLRVSSLNAPCAFLLSLSWLVWVLRFLSQFEHCLLFSPCSSLFDPSLSIFGHAAASFCQDYPPS